MRLGSDEEVSKGLEGVNGTRERGVSGLDSKKLHRPLLLAEERLDVYIHRIMADAEKQVISVGRA